MNESFLYYSVRIFGAFIRRVPLSWALGVGRLIGMCAYYFDAKHKLQVYANLKMAFAESKSPDEIKQITKDLFCNYACNLIELFRMPNLNKNSFQELVDIQGKEHIDESLKEGRGVILLAMHFGSWELANVCCAMLDHPYKMLAKPQEKFSKLDDLLNSYRECGGSIVLSRGMGTRDMVKSLRNNEVIGMVVDQGGRDGVLVPFFGREASMSVGAIRLALKSGVPVCFSIIIRQKGGRHKMIIHPPLQIQSTGNTEQDIISNLKTVTAQMESYIRQHPAEYMWFYKIWKYSKQTHVAILSDEKAGHLRQSQKIAQVIKDKLKERGIDVKVDEANITFKSTLAARLFSLVSVISNPFLHQGRLGFLKHFLTEDSFRQVMSLKAGFIVSCGSKTAGINHLLAQDFNAKSIAILKPAVLGYGRFDLVFLPAHDVTERERKHPSVIVTHGAPNLITPDYLKKESEKLLERFSHLKAKIRPKIGVLLGGSAKNIFISEQQVKLVVHQLKEAAQGLSMDLLVSTSRRTPVQLEQWLSRELRKDEHCSLLICANEQNVPEAVGGILGLSDIVVVSGDSISMVCEAASSGKKTIVFYPEHKGGVSRTKHRAFIERLNSQGFIYSCNAQNIGEAVYNISQNKIKTRRLDDDVRIVEAVQRVI